MITKTNIKNLIGTRTEKWYESRVFWSGIGTSIVAIEAGQYLIAVCTLMPSIFRLTNFIRK